VALSVGVKTSGFRLASGDQLDRDISVCGKPIGGNQDSISLGRGKPHFKPAALALVFKRKWNYSAINNNLLVGRCESIADRLALRRLHCQVQFIIPYKVTVFLARLGFVHHQKPFGVEIDIAGNLAGLRQTVSVYFLSSGALRT